MTKIITLLSGKGGVGKTVTCINLGTAFSSFGRSVLIVDGNLIAPHVGMYLGQHHFDKTLHSALEQGHPLAEAIMIHPSGLRFIPGDITSKSRIATDRIAPRLKELDGQGELILIDGSSGIDSHSEAFMGMSDAIVVLTTPDMPSVIETMKLVTQAQEKGATIAGIIVTKSRGEEGELDIHAIQTMLGHPVIETIPYDLTLRTSVSWSHPVVFSHPESSVSSSYKRLAALFIGQPYKESLPDHRVSWKEAFLGAISMRP